MGARPRASMSRPVVLTLVALSVLTLTSALPDSHDAVVPEDRGDQLTAVAAAQSDGFSPPTKAAINMIAFMQMYSSMSPTQAIITMTALLNGYICQSEEVLCALIRYFRTTIHMYRGKHGSKLSLQLSTTKDTSLTQSWKHIPAFLKILQHKRARWSELSKEERRTIAEAVQQATSCKDTSLTQNSKIRSKSRQLARGLVRCLVACLRKNCLTGV